MDRHKKNKMSLLSFFGGRRKKTAAAMLFTCNSVVLIFSSGRGNDSTLAKKSSAAPPHPTWNQSLASSVVNPLLWSHKCPEAEIEEKTPKHTRAHTNTHKTHIFFTAILNARKATECYKRSGRGGFFLTSTRSWGPTGGVFPEPVVFDLSSSEIPLSACAVVCCAIVVAFLTLTLVIRRCSRGLERRSWRFCRCVRLIWTEEMREEQ